MTYLVTPDPIALGALLAMAAAMLALPALVPHLDPIVTRALIGRRSRR